MTTASLPSLKAKEFEEICLYRLRQEEDRGRATMSRYGVQGVFLKGEREPDLELIASRATTRAGVVEALREAFRIGQASTDRWQPVSSLPDFEGVVAPSGRQFVFDCKVCSQASFALDEDKFKRRQLRHLLTRSKFGAITFLLLHFNPRELAKGVQPAETWAFPVYAEHPLWQAFDRAETKRITRADCAEYAAPCHWNTLPGGRSERPDVLGAVLQLASLPRPVEPEGAEDAKPF